MEVPAELVVQEQMEVEQGEQPLVVMVMEILEPLQVVAVLAEEELLVGLQHKMVAQVLRGVLQFPGWMRQIFIFQHLFANRLQHQ
jgi:hypothetical protein